MLRSDYDLVSGQQFTVRVAKQPDGSFQAHAPAAKDVPPQSAPTESRAIQKMNDALASFVANNYVKK